MEISCKRNLGIDLLKIISMFMVVVLHILGQGGVLKDTIFLSANYNLAWFLEIAAYCAVNCYALITGYVYIGTKYDYSKIIPLWLHVEFYTILITTIFLLLMPNTIGIKQIINAIFPVLRNQYWYFTAYFGLFFLIPFLNYMVYSLTEHQMHNLIITLIMIFSVLPTLSFRDIFITNGGYSPLWLAVLYLIGAYIKIKKTNGKNIHKRYMLFYIICIFIIWCSKIIIQLLSSKIFGIANSGNILISYTSPLILFAAIFLLLFFEKCEINKKITINIIRFFAPVSFGVYIIHVNPLIFENIIKNTFVGYSIMPTYKMFIFTISTAFSIYILCSLIDFLRLKLFELLKVNKLALDSLQLISKLFSKSYKKITQISHNQF